MKNSIIEPGVLTANCYFRKPAANAGQRRKNEQKQIEVVCDFFKSLGFDIKTDGFSVCDAKIGNIEVHFSYSESCKNVYKTFSVYKDGKKSNILTIRKLIKSLNNEN